VTDISDAPRSGWRRHPRSSPPQSRKWFGNLARLWSAAVAILSLSKLRGHMNPAPEQTHRRLLAVGRSALRLAVPGLLALSVLTVVASVPAAASGIKKPGAPTAVVATPGIASAAVSWTAPASDGGSPITSYVVTASHGGQTCTTTGATACTVTGLTGGQLYTIRVRALNAKGEGPAARVQLSIVPTVSFDSPVSFPYSGGPVGVALSQTTDRTVRIDFATSGGPGETLFWGEWIGAAASFSPSSGTVTFAPGQTTATISFTVNPPNVSGCSPFFPPTACYPSATVTLTNPRNALLGSTTATNLFYVGG
jgi:hypothetical protein